MSTRLSIAYWQPGKHRATHVYIDITDDRVYLDIGPHSYNRFCIPIAPGIVGRRIKRWKYHR